MTADRAECGNDWIKGYRDGQQIFTMSGISDMSQVKLYDKNGNIVTPVQVASLEEQVATLSETVQMLSAELEQLRSS